MPSKLQKSKKSASKTTVLASKSTYAKKAGSLGGSENNSRCSTPNSNTSGLSLTRNSSRAKSRNKAKSSEPSSRKSNLDYDKARAFDDEFVYGSDLELSSDHDDIHYDEDGDNSISASDDSFELEESYEDDDIASTGCEPSTNVDIARPPTPEFVPPEEVCPLQLPEGSDDLTITGCNLMQVVGIYEVLRRYSGLLRLSPFRFEDFCCSITCEEQSSLVSEVYCTLMKSLIREEDGNQTWFGPPDMKDSINIGFFFVDAMTWYECVRSYLDSDKSKEFQECVFALNKESFFAVKLDQRLKILQSLTDIFLSSNAVREDILKEGNIRYDEHCRYCHK